MSRAYLDPLHDELDRLRNENAALRAELADERIHTARRSAALNRTGTQNDHLRATVAACPRCANSLEPTT